MTQTLRQWLSARPKDRLVHTTTFGTVKASVLAGSCQHPALDQVAGVRALPGRKGRDEHEIRVRYNDGSDHYWQERRPTRVVRRESAHCHD